MKDMMIFVAGTPLPQSRPRITSNGVYSSASRGLKRWRSDLKGALVAAMKTNALEPLSGAICVDMICLIPSADIKRHWKYSFVKPDKDNLEKCIMDVMEKAGIFQTGDQQIADGRLRKVWCPPGREGVLITVRAAGEPDLSVPAQLGKEPEWLG